MIKNILLLLLCCSSVLAQTDKFQPAAGERVIGRYVVTIEDDSATIDLAQRARELAGAYGGRLEPYAGNGATFAVSMLPVRAKALSADPRVRSVIEVVPGGANPPAPASAQRSAAPSPTRNVKSNSYDATWTSGQYLYDGAGNIIAIGSNTYVYDGVNRLVKGTARTATYGNMQCFSYDAFGNMRQAATALQIVPTCADITTIAGTTTVAGVNPANNRIDVVSPAGVPAGAKIEYGTFDDTGNQISSDGLTQYRYDSMHRIEELTTPAQLRDETYLYDGSDDRVSILKFVGGNLVAINQTLRDTDGKVLREISQLPSGSGWTWQWLKDYVYRDSSLLAAVSAAPGNTTSTVHFHLDHLGSPRLITSDTGLRLAQHTYMPFGEEAAGSDRDFERMRFTGAERDDDSTGGSASLDYMHARFYRSALGRFLSVDPVLGTAKWPRPQSWNRYAYVRNNPVVRIDPDGRADGTTIGPRVEYRDDQKLMDDWQHPTFGEVDQHFAKTIGKLTVLVVTLPVLSGRALAGAVVVGGALGATDATKKPGATPAKVAGAAVDGAVNGAIGRGIVGILAKVFGETQDQARADVRGAISAAATGTGALILDKDTFSYWITPHEGGAGPVVPPTPETQGPPAPQHN